MSASEKSERTEQLSPKQDQGALAAVYFTVFIDLLGFGIILPSLPFFALDLGASGLELGILFTSYSLAQFLAAPVLGRLSDQKGRRPILLVSLVGASIAFVLTGLASSLWLLFAARALAGLFGGSISTAQAYIADVTGPEERAKYMGFLGASIGFGFAAGPALGVGLIALGWGFRGAAFTAAGLAAANFVLAWFRLTESRSRGAQSQTTARRGIASLFDTSALQRPVLRRLLFANLLTMAAFVSMETTFALLGEAHFDLDERDFGLTLVLVSVVMVIVQGGLVGRLARRFGPRPLAAVGSALMAISLLILPFVPSLFLAITTLGLLGAGLGLTLPTLSTLLSTSSGDDEQGSVLGLGQSFSAAARAFAPLVAGALYDLHFSAPYFTAGAGALLAAVLLVSLQPSRLLVE